MGELHAEIERIMRAHDDLIRLFHAKLAEAGIPDGAPVSLLPSPCGAVLTACRQHRIPAGVSRPGRHGGRRGRRRRGDVRQMPVRDCFRVVCVYERTTCLFSFLLLAKPGTLQN
jgi:hypothetical protein